MTFYQNHCDHCYGTRVSMYLNGFLYCSQECADECRRLGCWSVELVSDGS